MTARTTLATLLARILTTTLLAALTLAGCSAEPPPAEAPAQPVRVVAVAAPDTGNTVTANGLVAARDELRLAFKAGGVISRVLVDEGDTVRSGQLLADIATAEVDAQVTQAREQALKTTRDLERAQNLFERGLVARQVVQDAQTAADVAKAQAAAAEFNLSRARIVAPGNGVVLRRLAEPGETVAAGSPVLLVSSAGRGWILRAGVPDRVAVQLRRGDSASVLIDAWPGRTLPGRILQIAAASDSATGTMSVEIGFDPQGLNLASGLVGRAQLALRDASTSTSNSTGKAGSKTNSNTLAIPVGAILEGDGTRAHVFVLNADGKTVRRVDIETAGLRGEQVLVQSGLAAGDQVVSEGAAWLADGDRVALVP